MKRVPVDRGARMVPCIPLNGATGAGMGTLLPRRNSFATLLRIVGVNRAGSGSRPAPVNPVSWAGITLLCTTLKGTPCFMQNRRCSRPEQ